MYFYRPLADTPALMLEFAELSAREITRDAWMDWIERYGVLGLERRGKRYRAWERGGPGETLSRFREEAEIAAKALRLHGAATASDEPDVSAIAEHVPGALVCVLSSV